MHELRWIYFASLAYSELIIWGPRIWTTLGAVMGISRGFVCRLVANINLRGEAHTGWRFQTQIYQPVSDASTPHLNAQPLLPLLLFILPFTILILCYPEPRIQRRLWPRRATTPIWNRHIKLSGEINMPLWTYSSFLRCQGISMWRVHTLCHLLAERQWISLQYVLQTGQIGC